MRVQLIPDDKVNHAEWVPEEIVCMKVISKAGAAYECETVETWPVDLKAQHAAALERQHAVHQAQLHELTAFHEQRLAAITARLQMRLEAKEQQV